MKGLILQVESLHTNFPLSGRAWVAGGGGGGAFEGVVQRVISLTSILYNLGRFPHGPLH